MWELITWAEQGGTLRSLLTVIEIRATRFSRGDVLGTVDGPSDSPWHRPSAAIRMKKAPVSGSFEK